MQAIAIGWKVERVKRVKLILLRCSFTNRRKHLIASTVHEHAISDRYYGEANNRRITVSSWKLVLVLR